MDKTGDVTYSKLPSALKKLHCLYWSDFEKLQLPGTWALAPALAHTRCSPLGQHHVGWSCSITFSCSLQHLDLVLWHSVF